MIKVSTFVFANPDAFQQNINNFKYNQLSTSLPTLFKLGVWKEGDTTQTTWKRYKIESGNHTEKRL